MAKTYIIRAGYAGPVKIGMAINVQARLRELQTANHEKLRVVRIISKNVEWEMHKKFKHLRIHGEWFHFDEEMLTFLPEVDPLVAEYAKAIDWAIREPKTIFIEECVA